LWRTGSEHFSDQNFEAWNFQFDIQKRTGLIAAKDLIELRHRAQLGRCRSLDLKSTATGIVANYRLGVGRKAYIELKAVATIGESAIE
jgi:hypothetical protein